MSASLGGGQQHSQSQNTGSSSSQSESGNEGYGYSGGQSYGSSYGQSAGAQDVWGTQQPALADLYRRAGELAAGTSGTAMSAQQVANQAQGAWLGQLTPGGNPYFERSVQGAIDQATQGFTRDVLPELDARGVAVGQYGGARDNLARGEAAGVFGQGLANQVAGMYSQQYAGDQQRAVAALGLAPQVQTLQTQPLTTAAGIVGGPTVVGQQYASSGAANQASNFGENTQQGWASAISQAMNQGTSNASGWNANTSGGWKD